MKYANILIGLLAILNISLGIKSFYDSNKYEKIVKAYSLCRNQSEQNDYLLNYFIKSMEHQKDSWNKSFNVTSNNLNLNKGVYLCFRFSYRHCSACIDTELENLKNIAEDIGVDNILLLGDFPDTHQMEIFIDEHNLSYNILNCRDLNIGVDKYNNPYYFLVINNKIQYPFIPIKEYPNLFKIFIQNILPFFTEDKFT